MKTVPNQRILLSLLILLTVAVAPVAMAAPVTFTVDAAHSSVQFSVRHFVTQVPGHFNQFEGTITYDAETPANSQVAFVVQATSIDTGNPQRDGHLRSADFFDVENHATLSFTSTSVQAGDGNTLQVTGDFTLRGITQRMTIPVAVLGVMDMGDTKIAGFSTEFTIDRKAFGVSWNKALDKGGAILGDEVKISINVEAKHQAAATE